MKVKTGVIEDVESEDVINFEIRPHTSGFNRKLSVFRDLKKQVGLGCLRSKLGLRSKSGTVSKITLSTMISARALPV